MQSNIYFIFAYAPFNYFLKCFYVKYPIIYKLFRSYVFAGNPCI